MYQLNSASALRGAMAGTGIAVLPQLGGVPMGSTISIISMVLGGAVVISSLMVRLTQK